MLRAQLDRKKIEILLLSVVSCNVVLFWCVMTHMNGNINRHSDGFWFSECLVEFMKLLFFTLMSERGVQQACPTLFFEETCLVGRVAQ
jgi:hypothetical protein